MKEPNSALEEITIETPDFASDLTANIILQNQQQAPVFTKEEQDYIAGRKALSVALLNNNAPFSYSGKRRDNDRAMTDYFDRISQLSGLHFTFKGLWHTGRNNFSSKSGEADIAGAMVYDAVEAAADKIPLTNSYIGMALTQVTLKGTEHISTMAVPVSGING